jgi:hypothetical protein
MDKDGSLNMKFYESHVHNYHNGVVKELLHEFNNQIGLSGRQILEIGPAGEIASPIH